MRCDQCTHWRFHDFEEPSSEATLTGFRICQAMRMRERIESEAVKDVNSPFTNNFPAVVTSDKDYNSWVAVQIKALQEAKVYTEDGQEYKADVFTAPDFFCAKFEQKQPEG